MMFKRLKELWLDWRAAVALDAQFLNMTGYTYGATRAEGRAFRNSGLSAQAWHLHTKMLPIERPDSLGRR